MLRPDRLERCELIDIVVALQESFYLDTDEQGNAVWDPDSPVNGGDLVETMGIQLRLHQLAPEELLLARPDLTADNLFAAWSHGNRKAVARVMCERTRTEIAEFTVRLAEGPGTEEAGMFAALLDGMEVHSRRHDNQSAIDKSRRELYGNGAYNVGPNGPRTNGQAFRGDEDEEEEDEEGNFGE